MRTGFAAAFVVALGLALGAPAMAQDYWGYSTDRDSTSIASPMETQPEDLQGSDSLDDGSYTTYNYFYPPAPRPWFWRPRPRVYVSLGWAWNPWAYAYDPWYGSYWGPSWACGPWGYDPYFYGGYYGGWYPGYGWGHGWYGGGGRYGGDHPGSAPPTPTGHRGFGSTRGAQAGSGSIVDVTGRSARQPVTGGPVRIPQARNREGSTTVPAAVPQRGNGGPVTLPATRGGETRVPAQSAPASTPAPSGGPAALPQRGPATSPQHDEGDRVRKPGSAGIYESGSSRQGGVAIPARAGRVRESGPARGVGRGTWSASGGRSNGSWGGRSSSSSQGSSGPTRSGGGRSGRR